MLVAASNDEDADEGDEGDANGKGKGEENANGKGKGEGGEGDDSEDDDDNDEGDDDADESSSSSSDTDGDEPEYVFTPPCWVALCSFRVTTILGAGKWKRRRTYAVDDVLLDLLVRDEGWKGESLPVPGYHGVNDAVVRMHEDFWVSGLAVVCVDIIRNLSEPGDVLWQANASLSSAAFGVAALLLGRKWFGIFIQPHEGEGDVVGGDHDAVRGVSPGGGRGGTFPRLQRRGEALHDASACPCGQG